MAIEIVNTKWLHEEDPIQKYKVCAKCGSFNVTSWLMVYTRSNGIEVHFSQCQCNDCNHQFRATT